VFLSGRQSSNIVLTATDGTAANTLNVLSSTTYLVPHAEFNGKLAVANNGGTSGTTGLGLVDGAGNFTIFDPAYSSNSRFGMLPLNGKLFYNFSSLHATDGVTSYDTAVTGIDQLLRSASGRIYARKDGAGLLETNGAPSGTQTLLATPNTTEVEANVGRLFIAADEPYVYDLPVTATSFAPTSVDVAGGQSIAITGRGFTSPATVFVNGVVATGTGVTATTITFIAPPHEAGTYEVSLTLGDDRHFSLDTPLTYTCAAPAAAIAPLTGGVAPSTAVTLAGSGGTRCAWFPPIGLDDPSSCTPKATLTASMTFTLMVFNAAGCPSENNPSVRVRVSPPIPTSVRATADSATHVAVSWNASAGATQYEIARASADSPLAVIGTSASASFSDTSAAAGSIYIYRVRAIGPDATSPYSSGDFAATAAFTDDPIVPRQTVIKSAHITELRNVIDGIRVLAGLQSMTWSDAGVGATIRASQISELRTALAEALTAVGAPAASYTRSIVTGGVIRASDLQDVRAAIR
jgi:hypothetical protein